MGLKLIILDKKYAPSEMKLRTLELMLASKNCSATWFPRAFPGCRCIAQHRRDTHRVTDHPIRKVCSFAKPMSGGPIMTLSSSLVIYRFTWAWAWDKWACSHTLCSNYLLQNDINIWWANFLIQQWLNKETTWTNRTCGSITFLTCTS